MKGVRILPLDPRAECMNFKFVGVVPRCRLGCVEDVPVENCPCDKFVGRCSNTEVGNPHGSGHFHCRITNTQDTWQDAVCPIQDGCQKVHIRTKEVIAKQVKKIPPQSPDRGGYRDRRKKSESKGKPSRSNTCQSMTEEP